MSKYLNIYVLFQVLNFFIFKCQENPTCSEVVPKDIKDCSKYSNGLANCCLIHNEISNSKKCLKFYNQTQYWKDPTGINWRVLCEKSIKKSYYCGINSPLQASDCSKYSTLNDTCCYAYYHEFDTQIKSYCFFYGEKRSNLSIDSSGIKVICSSSYLKFLKINIVTLIYILIFWLNA